MKLGKLWFLEVSKQKSTLTERKPKRSKIAMTYRLVLLEVSILEYPQRYQIIIGGLETVFSMKVLQTHKIREFGYFML